LFETLSTEEKIRRARIQLLRNYPFWGSACMNLRLQRVKEFDTLGVSTFGELIFGDNLPPVVKTEEHLLAIVAHEVFHVIAGHLIRIEGRDQFVWNLAADLVTNCILTDNGFRLPEGSVSEEQLKQLGINVKGRGRTAEQVYDDLMKAMKDPKVAMKLAEAFGAPITVSVGAGEGQNVRISIGGNSWEVHKIAEGLTPSEADKLKRWAQKIAADAASYAKQQGYLPGGMEEIVGRILEVPRFDWKTALQQFITRVLPADYTYISPSKKSIATQVYLPTLKREGIEGCIVMDTSGSISSDELAQFKGQIERMVNTFENVNFLVIECDADIQQVYRLDRAGLERFWRLAVKGRGGTDFRPPIEYLEQRGKRSFLVYFTDGYGTFPEKKPSFPVMWVLTKDSIDPRQIPFGRVTKIWK